MIKGDCKTGEILIQGRSYPENAVDFYQPFLTWFDELKNQQLSSTKFTVDMEYFNTSSAGILFDFIEKVAEYSKEAKVQIVWMYEADDYEMIAKGKSLKEHFGELFELRKKED